MSEMNKPLFDLDQPGMQATLNSYKPGNGLVWAKLFPLKYTPKFDLKGIEGNEGIPVSADRVAFNVKAPLKTRKTVGSWSGKLSKYAVSREKDELAINEYKDLQIIAANNTEDKATAKYLVDMVYDDVKFVNEAMDYKVEIDALGIGCRGKQIFSSTVEGEMATDDVINFNHPAGNFGGVASATRKWNVAATADGLDDIAKRQKYIAKQGLPKPMYAIMETKAFEYLCAQESTWKKLNPSAVFAGTMTGDMVNLEAINKYQRSKGYPQIVVIDAYASIEGKDGSVTTIKPWLENVVVLSPTVQLGWTYYKPVPMVEDTDAVQAQASFYKTTRYSELNPMLEVTMGEAYVQPAPINRQSQVFLNVNETSWNEGNTSDF